MKYASQTLSFIKGDQKNLIILKRIVYWNMCGLGFLSRKIYTREEKNGELQKLKDRPNIISLRQE